MQNGPAFGAENIAVSANGPEDFEFDLSMLRVRDNQSADLERFARGASVLPGTYLTAIYVNDSFIENRELTFKASDDKTVAPCLTLDLVKGIPFDYSKLPDDFLPKEAGADTCIDLRGMLPDTQLNYDNGEQRLDILIPQAYMKRTARGYVNPKFWDSGVPAALFAYNANAYSSESYGDRTDSMYAGINAGFNLGSWYFRHNGSYNWMSEEGGNYDAINSYLQHDIARIKGRMLIGESNTSGTIFDTLPFTGVQVASDDRMLPDSLRGYAPEIRGLANTNARVTVRQGGQVIYETTVTPGEFLIDDLYPTGYGGDLQVTVQEADGSENTFLVPYASVAQLLRPGMSRYAFTGGKLRSDSLDEDPQFFQAIYQRGLSNSITGYGGAQVSENYFALQIGAALGTSLGAFAFDVTQARTQFDSSVSSDGQKLADDSMSGQSYRLTYSKNISETGSNLSVAAYRFSTDGYLDFMTAMQARDYVAEGMSADSVGRTKNRFTVTASQALPGAWGQFYVSGSSQNYWNKDGNDQQYQVGYSNRYKTITYGVNLNRTFSSLGDTQDSVLFSISVPLGREGSSQQVRMELGHNSDGRYSERAAFSGSGGKDQQYSYGVSVANANQGAGSSGAINGSYRGAVASLNGTYGAGDNYSSASVGVSGTVVGHSGGMTFSPYTSDTFALVEAQGAEGARVSSYPGVRVDSDGYALVPSLSPYQLNDISIDPNGISADTELTNTLQKVAPHSGAVVKVVYGTKQGIPLLIDASFDGEALPFGADVLDNDGNSVGSVGQAGMIYARVPKASGRLYVTWGSDQTCSLHYDVKATQKQRTGIERFSAECRPLKPHDLFAPQRYASASR